MHDIVPISGNNTVFITGSPIISSANNIYSVFPLDPPSATQTGSFVYPSLSSVATTVISYSTKDSLARLSYLF